MDGTLVTGMSTEVTWVVDNTIGGRAYDVAGAAVLETCCGVACVAGKMLVVLLTGTMAGREVAELTDPGEDVVTLGLSGTVEVT